MKLFFFFKDLVDSIFGATKNKWTQCRLARDLAFGHGLSKEFLVRGFDSYWADVAQYLSNIPTTEQKISSA